LPGVRRERKISTVAISRLRAFASVASLVGLAASAAACNAFTGVASLEESNCAGDCGSASGQDAAPDAHGDGRLDAARDAGGDPRLETAAPEDGATTDSGVDGAESSATDAADSAPPSPITFVQTNSDATGVATAESANFNSNVQTGNLIIVGFDYDSTSGATLANVTDSISNIYQVAVGPFDGAGIREYIVYAVNQGSGPDSVKVTLNASTTSFFEVRLHEYSGLAAKNPFDRGVSATGTSTAVDGMVTPPIVTSANNELIFGLGVCGICTSGTGFTLRSNFADDVTEDEIAATVGSYQGFATMTSGSGWAMSIAAFRGL
jgi:hypothetical protein